MRLTDKQLFNHLIHLGVMSKASFVKKSDKQLYDYIVRLGVPSLAKLLRKIR